MAEFGKVNPFFGSHKQQLIRSI